MTPLRFKKKSSGLGSGEGSYAELKSPLISSQKRLFFFFIILIKLAFDAFAAMIFLSLYSTLMIEIVKEQSYQDQDYYPGSCCYS